MRTPIHALVLSLALTLAGCGSGSEEPERLPTDDAATQQTPPAQPEQDDEPEVIDQAAGRPVEPVTGADAGDVTDPADADPSDAEQPTQSPLANLPGITPTQPTPGTPDADEAAGPLQVLVQVSVYELTPATPDDLAPLEQYLASSGGDTLAPAAVDAMSPLLSMLQGNGVVRTVSAPRVLIASGKQATVEVMSLSTGQASGLPTARDSLRIALSPTATPATGEGRPATVTLGYELRLAEADSTLEIVAQDLGLSVGPTATARATATLPDQHSHFFVRRVVGDDTDRELLVLIRPQVVEADLTK
ncbi:MAG: hypothetical protein ACF8Q5_12640 [Phycisphaerales bacterium JB040]